MTQTIANAMGIVGLFGMVCVVYFLFFYEPKHADPIKRKVRTASRFAKFVGVCIAAQVLVFILLAAGFDVFGLRSHLFYSYLERWKIGLVWEAFIPTLAIAGAYIWRWVATEPAQE
jgi:amino acid transporter